MASKIQFLMFLYLTIRITQIITLKLVSTIFSHLFSLLITGFSCIHVIFKSQSRPDDNPSSSESYILILDSSSPSLLPVPIHVATASIKTRVPIIPYYEFAKRYGGAETAVCAVCLECVEGFDMVRELCKCKHVFHKECLDRWVDMGHVNCPLCRLIMLPAKKKLVSSVSSAAVVAGGDPVM